MTTHLDAAPISPLAGSGYRSDRGADRFMRRVLAVDVEPVPAGSGEVSGIDSGIDSGASAAAHRAFRISVVVSAVRCLITYVLVPILIPILSLSGWVAAPIGMALCVFAVVNGVISVRRFWRSDHPHRWMYTAFIGVVFVILAIALVSDLSRLGVLA